MELCPRARSITQNSRPGAMPCSFQWFRRTIALPRVRRHHGRRVCARVQLVVRKRRARVYVSETRSNPTRIQIIKIIITIINRQKKNIAPRLPESFRIMFFPRQSSPAQTGGGFRAACRVCKFQKHPDKCFRFVIPFRWLIFFFFYPEIQLK